ncbi:IclR family transcriptional regulator [Youngiibacter fragilis]|uniref:Glycerol operon regulatory protein n=1 Tax=Youngiibacter fragilis 232.1 TaxID=994573 RepID=V7I5M1_9CLOT|nr:IclR family transcriptional regulator [Youngiibacter fragilis]ETA80494.1 IclR family transcriptional regulator [Youngiibacter fragilis 232.1]
MDRTGRVQSIDRAVMVLKCFSEKEKELSLAEIAERLDINKSTIHGIISTLKYHGLIAQDERSQKYRLGLGLMELGAIVSNSMDVNEIAEPYLADLCNKLEETVHMCLLDDKDVVYIGKKESNQSIRIITKIGSRIPAYCTGVGKAILANLEHDEAERHLPENLDKKAPKTVTDKKELAIELSKIKSRGYSIDDEEYTQGLYCVAAPIFDRFGNVKYAISTSGPTIRMTDAKKDSAIKLVTEAAKEISRKLGYEG